MIIVVIFAVPMFYIQLFDGEMDPVLSPLTIELISEYTGPNTTIIKGHAQRYRGECDWKAADWYLGPVSGKSVPVEVSFLDKPEIRPSGLMEWEGVIIGLSPEQVLANSHGYARYVCYKIWPYSMMKTSTIFYIGDGRDREMLTTESAAKQQKATQAQATRSIMILQETVEDLSNQVLSLEAQVEQE